MTATVSLSIDDAVPSACHPAIDHAFRVWAASRRLTVLDPTRPVDAAFVYGGHGERSLPSSIGDAGDPTIQDGLPWYFGTGRRDDHLAEIHAWVAAVSETDAPLDDLGRVRREASMPFALGVDPTVAWAERHMAGFDEVALARHPGLAPVLDERGTELTVLGSHDIDFLPTRRRDTATRLIRNVGVAALHVRDPRLVGSIAAAACRRVATRRPTLGGVAMVADIERRHDVTSTWNVLVRRLHARDANYDFDDSATRQTLDALAEAGHEIGLHGSYTSAGTPGGLAEELECLRRGGYDASGSRQHWLRHGGAALYQELAKAGVAYDSSFGWSDTCGFRHGMARPFVPFDVITGAPAPLLEVPLVIMDVALSEVAGRGLDPRTHANAVLDEAARYRGAVSVLWHDTTLSDTQIRRGVGPLYEALLQRGDRWRTSADVVERARPAWAAAGLPIN